ncbi:MAG: ATP-binding cassette domain-containing protein [Flavobacteriaceae bacterium]|nr:ATP-binding cassette domain-containing protein [Flavobacteriaceae bacterium]
MSIVIEGVSKSYDGQKVLDNVSLTVNKGEIVGFLGSNGAGKSTLMRIATGYLKADEGTVLINGVSIEDDTIKAQEQIGYLPENNPLYEDMYVREYLSFCASIHKVDIINVEDIITTVGLDVHCHKKIKELSKGYKQRVGLASAILYKPKVLILDEATTGLDPRQSIEIRKLIKELSKDSAILFSTHILQDVDELCDRIIFINKGMIVSDELLSVMKLNRYNTIEVCFDKVLEPDSLQRIKGLSKSNIIGDNTWSFEFEGDLDQRAYIFDFANQENLKILGMKVKQNSLDDLFKDLY